MTGKKGRLKTLKADLARAVGQAGPEAEAQIPPGGPAIRKSEKSVTPGGLLRRTVYFNEAEWAALMTESFQSGQSASEILRRLVRSRFNLDQSD